MSKQHCRMLQCRMPKRQHCRSNRQQSCLLLRQCCFDIVASVDRALDAESLRTDDRRRRQTPATVTRLPPTLYVIMSTRYLSQFTLTFTLITDMQADRWVGDRHGWRCIRMRWSILCNTRSYDEGRENRLQHGIHPTWIHRASHSSNGRQ